MNTDITVEEVKKLTPKAGFNLCGMDFFEAIGNRLYFIEHYEKYQDALQAKKSRERQDEYLILYEGFQM